MRSFLGVIFMALFYQCTFAQNSISGNIDPAEKRYFHGKPYDLTIQQRLRESSSWSEFVDGHGTWYVHFDEQSGMPHRAYGRPLDLPGSTLSDKAIFLASEDLASWNIPINDLTIEPLISKGKHTWVNFRQSYQGIPVTGSRYFAKFFQNKLVQFGCDVYPDIDVNIIPTLNAQQAASQALQGIENAIVNVFPSSQLNILPVPQSGVYAYHLYYTVTVKTMSPEGIPANYTTFVDAHSGEILSRQNMVKHYGGNPGKPVKPVDQVMQVSVSVTADVYENNPYEPVVNQGLQNIYVTVGGQDYQLGPDGTGDVTVNPGSNATITMQGPWSRIYSNGVSPQTTAVLADGLNTISFNANSNIRERSAYRSVQRIHDFMKFWLPDFDGMDYQLPTNIDEVGTCNAFYDGASINFYAVGGGCNASSLISDVCFHEYGHGINDQFYQSLSGNFINGAMGEGYADFWAIACTGSPLLGIGFYTENQDPLRRYDQEPMVYPDDISGEVHNDGEIIMGAWWDTHELMGADWNITMPLFIETYAGLQAEAPNGNEGVAYTDVLLDALQADDDDGDITNGTPHGDAIVDGFYIHGITLISNAVLNHTQTYFAEADSPISIDATLTLQFPFSQYLSEVHCFYKINNGEFTSAMMDNPSGSNYSLSIPGLEPSSIVSYYFGAYDVNGSLSAVKPVAAQQVPFANLPYQLLIGVQEFGKHDCDDNSDFGNWQLGVSDDNADTGEWIEDTPLGSYNTDTGIMVQPNFQHTTGGEFCFVTGNASTASAGLGENDVDAGKTTLQSPTIDMSSLIEPVVEYWRYYTNSPPSGANPGQDFWQVRMSNDGGANWIYVENNKTSDMSWRRNAFRVSDYLTPTSTMKFQFIASDSTVVGANLDGGSLVEAAVDDFVVYDALVIGVDEVENSTSDFEVYPNPAHQYFNIKINAHHAELVELNIIDQQGKVVHREKINLQRGEQNIRVQPTALSEGLYEITLRNDVINMTSTVYLR